MISVIMSTYKEKKEWLVLSIESILNQSYKDFEFIIVIDNPDNKELIEVVEGYANKDSRIIVLKNSENRGLVYSLNRALDVANGDYIARMDADDISLPDRLEKQKRFIENMGYDLVGASTRSVDEKGIVMNGAAAKVLVNDKYVKKGLCFMNCVAHPTWFVRKELYKSLNGYRNIKFCEDYDFLLRAMKLRARIGNVPEILLDYRYNYSGVSRKNKTKQRYISYYLASNRAIIDKLNESNINDALVSKKGKVEQKKLDNYFKMSGKILEAKLNNDILGYVLKSLKIVLINKYGRKTLLNIFKEKILRLADRRLK